jgi:hypothetical protein
MAVRSILRISSERKKVTEAYYSLMVGGQRSNVLIRRDIGARGLAIGNHRGYSKDLSQRKKHSVTSFVLLETRRSIMTAVKRKGFDDRQWMGDFCTKWVLRKKDETMIDRDRPKTVSLNGERESPMRLLMTSKR